MNAEYHSDDHSSAEALPTAGYAQALAVFEAWLTHDLEQLVDRWISSAAPQDRHRSNRAQYGRT